MQLYRDGLKPLTALLGTRQLKKLSAADVLSALEELSDHLSTRSLQIAHNCLTRAIRQAEADDRVGRNVAALVETPAGCGGRPSKALSVEQAGRLLRAAADAGLGDGPHRLHAYVVLLLTTGIRPEEARALRWDHVGLDGATVAVWRSDRVGSDTKTPKSRRTLRLAQMAVDALRQFTTTIGTMLDQHNIRREFRQITQAAGLGDEWVPRELRHTFVSIMSADGVPIEEIARLAGHQKTSTTELVYRRELRPVITAGAEVMAGSFRHSVGL